MPVAFTGCVEPREGYLYGSFSGTFDLAEAKVNFLRMLELCARHGLSRLLFDGRAVEGPVTVVQRYEWGVFLADAHQAHVAAGHQPLRCAFLLREPVLDPQRLGETVALNRGVDVRATDDVAEAADWLGIDPVGIT